MKICTKCNIEKPKIKFHNDKSITDGKYSSCKDCCKNYRLLNINKITAAKKIYNDANKGKIAKSTQAYRDNNKEKIIAANKNYRENNKEKIATYLENNKCPLIGIEEGH